ncbi:MAG: TolC family protein [Helicobacter sp.]|nr:TolC family protein [Helicobacter sp.]
MKAFLYLALIASAWAMSVHEVIAIALENNPTIEQQERLLESTRYHTKSMTGAFYPILELGYRVSKVQKGAANRNNTNGNEANLALRYNLFRGFADYHNRKNAQSIENAQQYRLQASKQELILAIKTLYIALLQQKEQLLVFEDSIKLLEQQLKETSEFFRVGLVAKNNVLQVEVSLASAKQNYLAAKSELAYLQKDLEHYAGRALLLEELQEVQFQIPEMNLQELESMMLANRSELKALEHEHNAQYHTLQSANGAYLPSVELVGEKTFATTADRDDQVVGRIELSLNLFEGFSSYYAAQRERANMLALGAQIAELRQQLQLQLFQAHESYTLALSAYKVAQEALIQAEENYRIVSNRYKERVETTSHLIDAELLLTQARTNVLVNRYGIAQAIAQIVRIVEVGE